MSMIKMMVVRIAEFLADLFFMYFTHKKSGGGLFIEKDIKFTDELFSKISGGSSWIWPWTADLKALAGDTLTASPLSGFQLCVMLP